MLAALIHLFPKHNLWICTQLFWSTMARPVLSGTCPVKPLFGLGHHAGVQFQALDNLLVAYAIIFVEQQSFFSDPFRKNFVSWPGGPTKFLQEQLTVPDEWVLLAYGRGTAWFGALDREGWNHIFDGSSLWHQIGKPYWSMNGEATCLDW